MGNILAIQSQYTNTWYYWSMVFDLPAPPDPCNIYLNREKVFPWVTSNYNGICI